MSLHLVDILDINPSICAITLSVKRVRQTDANTTSVILPHAVFSDNAAWLQKCVYEVDTISFMLKALLIFFYKH